MLSCTTNQYDRLYARWLSKPHDLLEFAAYRPEERLLDLCGGSGVISKAAVRMGGRHVTLLDLNPRCREDGVRQVRGSAGILRPMLPREAFDLVVCRQAIGYLDVERVFPQVEAVLKPGGRFVFNTFRAPRWAMKSYEHGGRRFFEASAHLFGRVFHIQMAFGVGADVTMFRWHKEDTLRAALTWGKVHVDYKERSSHWLCTKRTS